MSDPTPGHETPHAPQHAGDVPENALERITPYQAARRASPWGYVFLLGLAGLLTGVAWWKVEEETGVVTQAWIFVAALLTLAPIAWHAVDFFGTVASRRGGAFLAVVTTVALGCVVMGVASALNVVRKDQLPALDLTESGRYTLGEETGKILAKIPDGGMVNAVYLQRSGGRTSPSLRDMAIEQLKVYSFRSNRVTVRVFDDLREKDAAERYLRSVGVTSTSSGETDDLIVFTYAEPGREVMQGRQKEVRVEEFTFAKVGSVDGRPRWLGERVITSAIQELVFTKLRAAVTGGHGERGLADEMRELRERLRSQNVEVEDRPLDLVTARIPDDLDLLLVLGPESPFQPAEVEAIRAWLTKGRSLFVTIDVDETGRRRETGLEPLLDEYGLGTRPNYVVIAPNLLDVGGGRGVAVQMTPELWVGGRDYADHPSVEPLRRGGGFRTYFLNSTYVEVATEPKEGLTVDPVVWAPDPNLKDVRPFAARVTADRRDYQVPDKSTDRVGVRLPLVAVASRTLAGESAEGAARDARVVLSGDTDAFSDAVTQQSAANLDLFGGLSQWALRRADLAAVSDKTLDLEIADIGPREIRMAFWWPLVTALTALLAGAAVWWTRRR